MIKLKSMALWSTITVRGALSGLHLKGLFETPVGSVAAADKADKKAPPLSLAETNMREGNRIPAGMKFDVEEVRFDVLPGLEDGAPLQNRADMDAVKRHGVFAFDFLHTLLEVGSLGQPVMPYGVTIPNDSAFAGILIFGSRAPVLAGPVEVRVTLIGKSSWEVKAG